MSRKIWIILLVILIFLSSCGKKDQYYESIKIGAAIPLTGVAAIHGQNVREGIGLAVKEINNNGGVNGRQIKVIYEDDGADPKSSVSAIKKLIEIDKVDVLIGGVWDILANPIIPDIDQQKIVTLSPSALPDTLTETSPYFFSLHSPVAINQKAFEDYITKNLIKKVGIMVVHNPWGLAHLNTFKKAVEATGGEVVKEITLQNFDNNDLSTEITILKNLDLDAIFLTVNFNDAVLFTRKRVELDLRNYVLAQENVVAGLMNNNIPLKIADGITIFRYSEPSKEFIDKFYKEYNKYPEIYHDTSYDTIYALKLAIEKEGTGSENIIKGLREIKFKGASGEIFFGENNYPANKQPVLETIYEGKLVRF